MPVWKVLLIFVFACFCMSLATATFVIPFSYDGSQRWVWMGGLLAATLAAGGLFALFLRHADAAFAAKTR